MLKTLIIVIGGVLLTIMIFSGIDFFFSLFLGTSPGLFSF
jgi:ABC-type uncharacterized transport system permease subunit